ncbi:hypothetical protein HDU99_001700, partial [Rhizoclosmatium hyalinum]
EWVIPVSKPITIRNPDDQNGSVVSQHELKATAWNIPVLKPVKIQNPKTSAVVTISANGDVVESVNRALNPDASDFVVEQDDVEPEVGQLIPSVVDSVDSVVSIDSCESITCNSDFKRLDDNDSNPTSPTGMPIPDSVFNPNIYKSQPWWSIETSSDEEDTPSQYFRSRNQTKVEEKAKVFLLRPTPKTVSSFYALRPGHRFSYFKMTSNGDFVWAAWHWTKADNSPKDQAPSAIPDVPANISFPAEEHRILEFWKEIDAFQTSLKLSKGKKEFTFYDGPPFATGLPHYGHLLAGTIKDTVTRYAHQTGHHVERRFGWDCHGLPVEHEIDKKLNIKTQEDVMKIGIKQYNAECRSIVMKFSSEWETTVTRIGRWIDFKNDYKTLNTSFMESVWWVFKELFEKGQIYRGFS